MPITTSELIELSKEVDKLREKLHRWKNIVQILDAHTIDEALAEAKKAHADYSSKLKELERVRGEYTNQGFKDLE